MANARTIHVVAYLRPDNPDPVLVAHRNVGVAIGIRSRRAKGVCATRARWPDHNLFWTTRGGVMADRDEDEPHCTTCGNTLIATIGPLCSWCALSWSQGESHGVHAERSRIVAWLRSRRACHEPTMCTWSDKDIEALRDAANAIERGEVK
jgi:hypothetical protein